MPSGNPSRLLALADREFRELTNKPLTAGGWLAAVLTRCQGAQI